MSMPLSPPVTDQVNALIQVARKLSSAMDLNALLHEILTSSQKVMRAEAGSIFLPDLESGELIIHSASGDMAPQLNATRIPKGLGVAGAVYEQRQLINITDPKNDPRHYGKVDEKTGFQTRAMVTAPLLSGERCLGVVQVLNPVDRDYFDPQDVLFFEGFAGLIASTLIRLESQQRALDEEKARQELTLAREIQESFLPSRFKIFPNCQTRMFYSPAREVGGDFCFIHSLEEGRLLCGLADVSGKGVPAALTMARSTAEIKGFAARLENHLGEWVGHLNTHLCEELSGGRFIGITFLLANPSKAQIQVCNAGQYAPMRFNGRRWESLECPPQLPIGVLPGFAYQHTTFDLSPGQLWLLYSDGITEARNTSGEEYGQQRLSDGCPGCADAKTTLTTITSHWSRFTGDQPQHDDASLLLLDWRGTTPPSELHLECQTANLCSAREFIESWGKYCGYDDISVGQIVLACDEAVTNIYRYAYDCKGGSLHIRVFTTDTHLNIHLTDQGTPVDPEKIKGRALDELRPGGLGTVLLQQIFDSVVYQPQPVGTLLQLSKPLPG